MPLHAEGMKKSRAFLDGVLSGAVEPIGAVLTVFGRPAHCAGAAVPFELRRRSNAVRRRRGAYPRNVTGHALQHRHGVFCRGLYRMMILDVALG